MSQQPDASRTFQVYTRIGCGCCVKALAVLHAAQQRHGFNIETIDIDRDPELVERYGALVPVVALGGKVRFRGQVAPGLLERLIAAEWGGD